MGLIIDNFAGGGGASTGIAAALGRHVDYAINHDAKALDMHTANHPETIHLCEDVFDIKPRELCGGRPVDLVWFSPDCRHHSKAKGGKPNRSRKVRGLAWVAVKWADQVKPRVMFIENVEEFQHWGPLDAEGRPIKERRGQYFRAYLTRLRNLGYKVDHRELVAADYGAPTIRKRLFVVARRLAAMAFGCGVHRLVAALPKHLRAQASAGRQDVGKDRAGHPAFCGGRSRSVHHCDRSTGFRERVLEPS